jgi:hypothetical protein
MLQVRSSPEAQPKYLVVGLIGFVEGTCVENDVLVVTIVVMVGETIGMLVLEVSVAATLVN